MGKLRKYMTIKEAAAYLGVSPNTLRAWGDRGEVKEYRNPANNYRLFRRTDLDRFLKKVERSAS